MSKTKFSNDAESEEINKSGSLCPREALCPALSENLVFAKLERSRSDSLLELRTRTVPIQCPTRNAKYAVSARAAAKRYTGRYHLFIEDFLSD